MPGAAMEDQGAAGACEPGQASMPPSPSGGPADPSADGRPLAQGGYADGMREGGGAHSRELRALQPGLLSTALAQKGFR